MSEITIAKVSNGWIVREGSRDSRDGYGVSSYDRIAVARTTQELAAWVVEFYGEDPVFQAWRGGER